MPSDYIIIGKRHFIESTALSDRLKTSGEYSKKNDTWTVKISGSMMRFWESPENG